MVVSNSLLFSPRKLGRWSNLTNISPVWLKPPTRLFVRWHFYLRNISSQQKDADKVCRFLIISLFLCLFSLLFFFTPSMFTLLYLNSPRYDISLFKYLRSMQHSIWTTYRNSIKYQLTLYYISSTLQTHTHMYISLYLYIYTQYASYIPPYQLVFLHPKRCLKHLVFRFSRKRVAKFHWSLVPLLNVGGPRRVDGIICFHGWLVEPQAVSWNVSKVFFFF